MAQNVRQSRLFAAEDYTAVYESYVNANLQAYDFDTIRSAMVEYIRATYPENYNDWVESAEFVALLDVIAQFGHNLAFRVDLNSRNNFLSTADRQDAVFKLAEFLGYQPRRNVPATGHMKVVSVKTNETVIGAAGTTLGGKELRYDNSSNADNLDDFITVMNAIFSPSNQFGSPRKEATINSVLTQFYNLNNLDNQNVKQINGNVQGTSQPFNVISMNYDGATRTTYESEPNPGAAFTLMYRNDGRGISSQDTGFFMAFKQGNLTYRDFVIDSPIDNQVLDIDVTNVNQTDVWVQTIDNDGNVLRSWSKVDSVAGRSTSYSALADGVRDIYSVKTLADNKISIQFPDRRFGNLPRGNIRVWYRTSVNETYVLRPDDMGSKTVSFTYKGIDGNQYTAVFGLQLYVSVNNASKSESLDDIKAAAPRIYATQDRMITASDYGSYLLRQSDSIIKIKPVNRTHSGHSRYVELVDPTGMYRNLNIYATDGIIYKYGDIVQRYATNVSPKTIYEKYIKTILSDDETINLYYDAFRPSFEALKDISSAYEFNDVEKFRWVVATEPVGTTSTGYFEDTKNFPGEPQRVGKTQGNWLRYVTVGAMVKFRKDNSALNKPDEYYWAKVSRVYANGLGVDNITGEPTGLTTNGLGAIALDAVIPTGCYVEMIYPALVRQFTESERELIIAFIDQDKDFAIKYDYVNLGWDIIADPTSLANSAVPNSFGLDDDSWLIQINYDASGDTERYVITNRVVRYEVRSNEIDFSNISNEYELDFRSRKKKRDTIQVWDFSTIPAKSGTFYVYGYHVAENGIYDPNRVILALVDNTGDERPDNPESFANLATGFIGVDDIPELVIGAENLRLEWKHIPDDNEIPDPSFTNIIDVFTLTKQYDTEYRAWLTDQRSTAADEPLQPTVDELSSQFKQITNRKAMSDTIIYRPVKYRVLFGPKAESELQATFRIIPMYGTNLTTNEIKTRVVEAINSYFEPANWDFGEPFYFTELAAYVHKEMAGILSSFVIVPQDEAGVFGNLFQITPRTDELFIPDVSVTDIDIIDSITADNIRAR